MSPREIWCNEAQERYVLAIAPARSTSSGDLRARALPVRGARRGDRDGSIWTGDRRHFGNKPVDMPMRCCSASRRDAARRAPAPPCAARFDLDGIELREAAYRVLRCRRWPTRSFLITSATAPSAADARDQMVGPWQVPVADVAVTLSGSRPARARRGDGRAHAARGDRRARIRPHGGRRGDHQHRRGAGRRPGRSSCRPTGWRLPAIPARTPPVRHGRAVGELCPALGIASRSARTRCR
jgi:phosphoribosylformylglycinamidine (FGAM) synthase-like enzyme